MAKFRTLAECKFSPRPKCHHCDRLLARSTPIQVFADAVVAKCRRCGCMTPFKLRRTA